MVTRTVEINPAGTYLQEMKGSGRSYNDGLTYVRQDGVCALPSCEMEGGSWCNYIKGYISFKINSFDGATPVHELFNNWIYEFQKWNGSSWENVHYEGISQFGELSPNYYFESNTWSTLENISLPSEAGGEMKLPTSYTDQGNSSHTYRIRISSLSSFEYPNVYSEVTSEPITVNVCNPCPPPPQTCIGSCNLKTLLITNFTIEDLGSIYNMRVSVVHNPVYHDDIRNGKIRFTFSDNTYVDTEPIQFNESNYASTFVYGVVKGTKTGTVSAAVWAQDVNTGNPIRTYVDTGRVVTATFSTVSTHDLQVVEMQVLPSTIVPGNRVSLVARVINNGSSIRPVGWRVKFTLTWPNNFVEEGTSDPQAALSPGADVYVLRVIGISEDRPIGDYGICAVVV